MTSSSETLSDLEAKVWACSLCDLGVSRLNAVPGEGPHNAEIICIGEAPGANEDRQGRPFVGAAGQFLEECLAQAGYARDEVYICNVLKCRPPNNRDPLPDEIQSCSPYLERQLELVNPLVVVTLGRFSMARFFPNRIISKVHGRWKQVGERYFVPMYHPAAALHQGSLRATLLEDFARLPKVVERAKASRETAPNVVAGQPSDEADSGLQSEQMSLFD